MRLLIAEDDRALGQFLSAGWRLMDTVFVWPTTALRLWRHSARRCQT